MTFVDDTRQSTEKLQKKILNSENVVKVFDKYLKT